MATIPYLTTDQFRISTGGWDVGDIPDDELYDILLRASQICDDYTGATWGYQDIWNEIQPWKGLAKPIYTKKAPIRVVRAFRVFVGTSNIGAGSSVVGTSSATIPTTPVGPDFLAPGEIPWQFGYVTVDRENDRLDISQTNWNMRLLAVPWFNGLATPKLLISYSTGYDPLPDPNGTTHPGADGYYIPYPVWLTSATRIIAGAMIGERNTTIENLGGIMQARQGDSEFRRYPDIAGSQDNVQRIIPAEALSYLQRRHRTVLL